MMRLSRMPYSKDLPRMTMIPRRPLGGTNSISKTPILQASSTIVPDKVVCLRDKVVYSIRKAIDPNLSIEKVLDPKVRQILLDRIKDYGGDVKKAFANLDLNPIWLNKEKGIKIKRATITENSNLVVSLHRKRGRGGLILEAEDGGIPNDFVFPKDNHHAAIYYDADGKYKEKVVTFIDAMERVRNGESAINKEYKKNEGWQFAFSIKKNELFVFPDKYGFDPHEIDLMNPANYPEISKHLFIVQSISEGDYSFIHHLQTTKNKQKDLKGITWERFKSINEITKAVKVRINHIGQIVDVGEYD